MICIKCEEDKAEEEFSLRTSEQYREGKRRTECKTCAAARQRASYQAYKARSYFKYRVLRAKSAATTAKVPFNLDAEYLESIWTDNCPILGFELKRLTEQGDPHAAELDRFLPNKGYVKGNVAFVSRRANQIKSGSSYEELKALLDWMEIVRQN